MNYSKYINFFDCIKITKDFKFAFLLLILTSLFFILLFAFLGSIHFVHKLDPFINYFLFFVAILDIILIIIVVCLFFTREVLASLRIFVFSFLLNFLLIIVFRDLLYREEYLKQLSDIILIIIIVMTCVISPFLSLWIGDFLIQLIANSISYPFRYMKVRRIIKRRKLSVEFADTTILGCYVFNRLFVRKYKLLCGHNRINESCICVRCGEEVHDYEKCERYQFDDEGFGNWWMSSHPSFKGYYLKCKRCDKET